MARAQEIADQILASDRMASSSVFADRVFADEPILRAGIRPCANRAGSRGTEKTMPAEYRKMRRLARGRSSWNRGYAADGGKLFYEQGKLMENFSDDFEGSCEFLQYFPTYEEMSNYQLRCYFSWRTRVRAGEEPEAPTSFLFVYVYELLCGIGVDPGLPAYKELVRFSNAYAHASDAFRAHMVRWLHDYVVYYDLDPSLLVPAENSFPVELVGVLRTAEEALLARKQATWPDGSPDWLPQPKELLDALMSLSRYRADRSQFVRKHREDVALVACRVFARMVAHCNKRRKTDYVDGLFGAPVRMRYTMFPSAVVWMPTKHKDASFEASESEKYVCEGGFWWRELPCRRLETSRELGALLHAIDARMRVAMDDAHPLKARPLPKYQAKFVDEEIAAFLAQREAQEKAQIHIDRSALGGIRSASVRTREALLTDDEREECEEEPVVVAVEHEGTSSEALGLTDEQNALLFALLRKEPLPNSDGMFLSLAVDAINEAFLDIVGDTVLEYDGDIPELVEDYVQDIRDALA